MRVATFNLQHGTAARGTEGWGRVPDASSLIGLADELRPLEIDVLCLQEADQGQGRSSGLNQTEILARELGMDHYRFAAFFQGWVGGLRRQPMRSDAGGRMAFGIATLSRFPVSSWHIHPMPRTIPAVRFQQGTIRRPSSFVRFVDTTRVLLGAVVESPDGAISVANTHLTPERRIARKQLGDVMRSVNALPEPRLLLGDLSLDSEEVALETRMNALASGQTYPSQKPRQQPDHILGTGVTARDSGDSSLQVSDHRLLWADI
ncbi:MAG TPA: endonuclease/exonuclease/phosphatase family protein [Actinomycetaceae bacterium]|nr:endonuclease/exonuclease/phosphatase family protein [Actinomycetaceae bacterium]